MSNTRSLANVNRMAFPTPGATWTRPRLAGAWSHAPSDPDAVLLRSRSVDVEAPDADALVAFDVGALHFEVGIN